MKRCLVACILVALFLGACDRGIEPQSNVQNDAVAEDSEAESEVLDLWDLDWVDTSAPCAESPCTAGEQRCVPTNGYHIERCEETGGCTRWVFVEYCPSDYTCHSLTTCEGDHCGEIPWPPPPDRDGDGYGADFCSYPQDCDDQNPDVNPGAEEVCNGIDDNCDGETDSVQGTSLNLPMCRRFFVDKDGDGHGDPRLFACLCVPQSPYVTSIGDDCDDSNPGSPLHATGCVGECPNGVREPPEICDDGNLEPFDGCDSCFGELNFITPAQWADVSDPAVAVAGNKVIVAWSARTTDSGRKVFFRAIQGESLEMGEIGEVKPLGDVPSSYEGSPALAAKKDGRLLAVWDTVSELDKDFEVRVRPFVSDEPYGASLVVNEHWEQRQLAPAVAVSDDAWLVAWQSYDQDGDGYEVYGRFLDASGVPFVPEFRVNQTIVSDQFLPVVAGLPSNRFAVAWLSRSQNYSRLAVVWTVLDTGINVLVPESILSEGEVTTEIGIASSSSRVAVLFLQQYSSGSDVYTSLHVKTIDPSRPSYVVHEVVEFPPTSGPRLLYNPAIVATDDGFLVTYRAKAGDGWHYGKDLYSRTIFIARFNANGELLALQSFPKDDGSAAFWVEPDWPIPLVLPGGAYGAVFECVSRDQNASYGRGICLSIFTSQ